MILTVTRRSQTSLLISMAIHGALLAGAIALNAPEFPLSSSRQPFEVSMGGPSRSRAQTQIAAPKGSSISVPNPPPQTGNAPNEGVVISNIDAAQTDAVIALIRARVEQKTHYPLSLRRRGVMGRVELSLALNADGGIEEVRVSKSSQSPALDQIAMKAVQNAAPFDEAISHLRATGRATGKLKLSLPIEFKLN